MTDPGVEEPEAPPPPEPYTLDAANVNALLDIVLKTVSLPNLMPLNQAAMFNLSIIADEVKKEMEERAKAQAEADAEAAAAKAAAEAAAKEEQADAA